MNWYQTQSDMNEFKAKKEYSFLFNKFVQFNFSNVLFPNAWWNTGGPASVNTLRTVWNMVPSTTEQKQLQLTATQALRAEYFSYTAIISFLLLALIVSLFAGQLTFPIVCLGAVVSTFYGFRSVSLSSKVNELYNNVYHVDPAKVNPFKLS